MKRISETGDDYPHVVVVLDAKTRVIECADGIQWAIQVKTPASDPISWREHEKVFSSNPLSKKWKYRVMGGAAALLLSYGDPWAMVAFHRLREF
jgi:hypothetical protein